MQIIQLTAAHYIILVLKLPLKRF